MKVLWILNSPIGEISKVLGLRHSQSGTWIDAAMESLLEQADNISLTVATTAKIPKNLTKTENRVNYVCLSGGRMLRGRRATKKQLSLWKKIVLEIQPDLIHIWGTEFSLGYDLRRLFPDIPFLYTMQGVMTYIAKYPYLNLPEMKKKIGVFSKLRCYKYQKEQALQELQAQLEQMMIAEADGVIADNEWAISPFINHQNVSKFHFIRLPIKKQFRTEQWKSADAAENTLFCIAGRSALKGIHQVIKAVLLLKQDIPDIRVLIPGNIKSRKPAFLFEPPYLEYLRNVVAEYHLEDNIQFLGQLTTDEMISYMKQAKVFVMPSAIENESSTLREAMFLGMPVVTSCVGDIYEVIRPGKNGRMYRFEEYEMMAYHIRELLLNPDEAETIGNQARETMVSLYQNQTYATQLSEVYRIYRR